ncbi:ATP-dependent DNA helicase RecQ [Nitrosomonas sp. Nm132]|nr:ATP-dependent DNA helicase RecQ [Nitrosomonas sp. Nm132]
MWLAENSIPAIPYRPGMDIQTRIEHQEKFLREEDIVTIATTAFGLGIDKPDVRSDNLISEHPSFLKHSKEQI